MQHEQHRLIEAFSKMKGRRVLVLGDVMLDRYKFGEVTKLSQEAPVVVLKEHGEKEVPGGAANVAMNIAALGGSPHLIGVVGDDGDAEALERLLDGLAVPHQLHREKGRVTTLKTRFAFKGHQFLRLDRENTQEISAESRRLVIESFTEAAVECDCVVFSDYAKGFFSPRFSQSTAAVLADMAAPLVVDPKPANSYLCDSSYLMMPNLNEAAEIMGQAGGGTPSGHDLARALARLFNTNVLITEGENGMTLCQIDGEITRIESHAREVYDVSGAGDTAVAAAALAIGAGMDLYDAASLANLAAGIAVSKAGTAVVFPEEMHVAAGESPKIFEAEQLVRVVKGLKEAGRKVVFTNGCFDLLHVGHINYLKAARSYGDVLIVALNTDESIKRLKGPGRPLIPLKQRMDLIASLQSVDYVTAFSEDDPRHLISLLEPHIFVKGGDYTEKNLPEAPLIKAYGGEIKITPLFGGGISSSRIIEQIFYATPTNE